MIKVLATVAVLFFAITLSGCVKAIPPLIEITAPSENDILKAGEAYAIEWIQRYDAKAVRISLYYGKQLVTDAFKKKTWEEKLIRNNLEEIIEIEAPNTGSYFWEIPRDFIASGKNFHIKISVPEHQEIKAKSKRFEIKPLPD